ncbi:GATOR complex protein WDR24 [Neocloeon triangulifer]|uniref:GATOR complex protein WDR24 n=1 Tax=Neocloeon triangulifer TaxID=2078957 RepID=UPI00286F5BE7|nr:GATOR complex protein WDR24 [Neocloeon triangulifer]
MAKAKTMFATQEGPANALALNKDCSQVVIAGRNVFKVFNINAEEFVENCNLRVGKNINLNFSCNDVVWNTFDDSILATAATNGAVVVWNLNKPTRSKQEHVFNDHRRTVNKVSFHPTEAVWLISGSQDGTMKCFDLRIKEATRTFISKTESVRDVQFSPHQMHTFSAVAENGNVQLWDLRKPDRCLSQFTAHSGPVFACDWHPEMCWLATASRDKTIKVWDLTSKPSLEYTIPTIASVGHIKWRPQRKHHIASCALVVDCSVNIWDIRRPYIAFASFNEHQDVATGVAWRGDPHILLSTSKDFTLYQHVFKDAARPESKANPQGISFNSKGDMSFSCKININPATLSKLPALLRKTPLHSDQFCQVTSSMHTFVSKAQKEVKCFLECAKRYQLSGKPLAELCDHNAAVAKQLGRHQVSLVWGIVKTLYCTTNTSKVADMQQTPSGKDSRDDPNITPGANSEAHNGTDGRHTDKTDKGDTNGVILSEDNDTETDEAEQQDQNLTTIATGLAINQGDFFFGDGAEGEMDQLHVDYEQMNTFDMMQQDWTLPSEAFNLRHEIEDRSPPPEQFPNHCSVDMIDVTPPEESNLILPLINVSGLPRMSLFDPSEVVASALNRHAESSDVQTAASVLLVLGEKRAAHIEECKQETWLLGYLELLGRHKLWNTATKVIKLSWLPSIHQLNQQSTTLPTNCASCSRPLRRSGWQCDNCHHPCGKCAVCNELVKGIYSWCQGCSHGGHLAHMQDWLAKHRSCPAGCGHACEYD